MKRGITVRNPKSGRADLLRLSQNSPPHASDEKTDFHIFDRARFDFRRRCFDGVFRIFLERFSSFETASAAGAPPHFPSRAHSAGRNNYPIAERVRGSQTTDHMPAYYSLFAEGGYPSGFWLPTSGFRPSSFCIGFRSCPVVPNRAGVLSHSDFRNRTSDPWLFDLQRSMFDVPLPFSLRPADRIQFAQSPFLNTFDHST